MFYRPEQIQPAYAGNVCGFLIHTGMGIQAARLGNVQPYVAGLVGLAPASRLSTVNSSRTGMVRLLPDCPYSPLVRPTSRVATGERPGGHVA